MSTISLFQINGDSCHRLSHQPFGLERELQRLIEKHMEGLLGARFVKTEHAIPNGRIDTLGLDENQSPVIIEYKRGLNESVLSQSLFYLDWLVNHKGDFTLLVQNVLGIDAAKNIDWKKPRLICIAEGYSPYDRYAVNQIGREIQLIQYSRLPNELLLLELLNDSANPFGRGSSEIDSSNISSSAAVSSDSVAAADQTNMDALANSEPNIQSVFGDFNEYVMSLGADIERRDLKFYIAYRKVKNFTCAVIQVGRINLYLKLNPDTITTEEKIFAKDKRGVNHWGTGDLEIILTSHEDLERAKPLIERAYSENL